jgi:MFS family permease
MWTAVFVIYLPSMLMMLGQGMIIPALPAIAEVFNVPGAVAVQALTAQLIGRAVAQIPAGAMVDRWGTKPPMLLGAGLATMAAAVAAIAPGFLLIVVSQVIWGIGMSMWMFGREIAAFDMVRVDQRGRQMSALMGIGSTGSAFGPAIGGVLTDTLGVRSVFIAYGLIAALVLAISTTHRDAGVRHTRRPGGGFFSLRRFNDIHPYFRATYLILFFSTFGQMVRGQITNSMLPLYSQEQLGYSATTTGLLFSVIGIMTFVMILPTGFISDKIGRKWAAGPAAVFSGIGFLAFPLAESVTALAAVAVTIGIANGLALGAMTIYTYDIVPDHARGQLQAMRRTFGEFGAVLSPPLGGIIAAAYSPSATFWVFAPLHWLSAFLLFFVAKESLNKRLPPDDEGPEP